MRRALVVGVDEYVSCLWYGCCNDTEATRYILVVSI